MELGGRQSNGIRPAVNGTAMSARHPGVVAIDAQLEALLAITEREIWDWARPQAISLADRFAASDWPQSDLHLWLRVEYLKVRDAHAV